jgi:hypothetical protein
MLALSWCGYQLITPLDRYRVNARSIVDSDDMVAPQPRGQLTVFSATALSTIGTSAPLVI